ncbi:hypothetical protein M9H77_13532 [Catharanthus roseus]|uniref:Uncharacterized protein n=1 Tax=Catharanthus roseus TaxID=4058 RepID=A0ACC0BKP0_CATRO|nr:hypothetical protein M9H77_13532 [Catharanthus roseus]
MRHVLLIFSVDVSVAVYFSLTIQLPVVWSRILVLQPQLLRRVQDDPLVPLGAMWCTSFDCSQLPTHTLITYRDWLDFIPSDQIQRKTVSITKERNVINMTEHVIAITHIVSDELSMLYPTVNNDDDEIDHSDEDYVVSSKFESDDNNNREEEKLQTPVNPITENTVT